MPELLIDFITSLDGYGAADGWPGWWGLEGPEYLAPIHDDVPIDGYAGGSGVTDRVTGRALQFGSILSPLSSVVGASPGWCRNPSECAHDIQHQPVGIDHEEVALAIILVADLGDDLSTEPLRPLVGLVDVVYVDSQSDTVRSR